MDGPVLEPAACRRRDDLRSRKLQNFPWHRRAGEGRRQVMRGTGRFAVEAEEFAEGMANGVANAPA